MRKAFVSVLALGVLAGCTSQGSPGGLSSEEKAALVESVRAELKAELASEAPESAPSASATASATPSPSSTPAEDDLSPRALGQAFEFSSGSRMTVGPLEAAKVDGITGSPEPGLCTTASILNAKDEVWAANPIYFELSYPDKTRQDSSLLVPKGAKRFDSSRLLKGDELVGMVCFPDDGQRGEFTVIYEEIGFAPLRWTGQFN